MSAEEGLTPDAAPGDVRVCAEEGCPNLVDSPQPSARYCSQHRTPAARKARSKAGSGAPGATPEAVVTGLELSKAEKRLQESLVTMLGMVSLSVGVINSTDGLIISHYSDQLATALVRLARTNKAIAAFLRTATTGSDWTLLLAAVLPMVGGILANHGMALPVIGVIPSEVQAQAASMDAAKSAMASWAASAAAGVPNAAV